MKLIFFCKIDIIQGLKNATKGDWIGEKNSPCIQVFIQDEWDRDEITVSGTWPTCLLKIHLRSECRHLDPEKKCLQPGFYPEIQI